MPFTRPLIAPVTNPPLEKALQQMLRSRRERIGSLGELEPLAIQLGLMQNTLKPAFAAPQMLVFAADHGLAVDGAGASSRRSTAELVHALVTRQLPLEAFARIHGLSLSVVDCGVAEPVLPHAHLVARKIAHGTRSARAGPAMSPEQAQAALRAGAEIVETLPGNVVACAGIGVGSHESAALLIARLSGLDLGALLARDRVGEAGLLDPLLAALQGAQTRHREVVEPLAVLAAFGGFEMAMMVGLMLTAASERRLIIVDGMAACAALLVASRLAPAVTDYCLHSRSHSHRGLDEVLGLFGAAALLELGIESMDGTGAALAWPLVRSAAALLTEVHDPDDEGAAPAAPAPGR